MLWSPSEVLPYMRDEKPSYTLDDKQADRLVPTAAYGGFLTWPTPKEDFILFAENSEIHGPNPIFTIPELDDKIDLNLLSTHILSADYQGLSNNKILPGKNAQLLMPDLSSDTHAAISLILQHFNIACTVDDLKSFEDGVVVSSKNTSEKKSADVVKDLLLKDIQEILHIIEEYKGNEIYDQQMSYMLKALRSDVTTEEIQSWISMPLKKSTSVCHRRKKSSTKISMKDLYQMCDKGVILALYHAFISHQCFNRKYENIVSSNHVAKEKFLLFGACILNSKSDWYGVQNKNCLLKNKRIPSTFSLADDDYCACLNGQFVDVLERFISWNKRFDSNSPERPASSNYHPSSDLEIVERKKCKENCSHIVSLGAIWDVLESIELQIPGVEKDFLRVLKLFDNSQGLLFSLLCRSPIVVISSPTQLQEATHFLAALSAFIPTHSRESIYVDTNRKEPLTRAELEECVALNICVEKGNAGIENIQPVEWTCGMCILNLKDCSLTTPSYAGRLLADVDQRIRALPEGGPLFSVLVGLLAEMERTIQWWDTVTSSSAESSAASAYVLSKGYTRSDMHIIEKLYRLWGHERKEL